MQAFIDPNHKPMGMASDDHNPNFVGAKNPDDALWATFYHKKVLNHYQTTLAKAADEQASPIFDDRIFVKIEIPGRPDLIIDVEVEAEHKRRFPRQWNAFQKQTGEVGTPLAAWSLVTSDIAEFLNQMKFRTVEMVAMASDESISRLGMGVGMAPLAFRQKAQEFLKAKEGGYVAAHMNEQIQARDKLIDELRKGQEEMQRQMAELLARSAPANTDTTEVAPEVPKKKPGRPRKADAVA